MKRGILSLLVSCALINLSKAQTDIGNTWRLNTLPTSINITSQSSIDFASYTYFVDAWAEPYSHIGKYRYWNIDCDGNDWDSVSEAVSISHVSGPEYYTTSGTSMIFSSTDQNLASHTMTVDISYTLSYYDYAREDYNFYNNDWTTCGTNNQTRSTTYTKRITISVTVDPSLDISAANIETSPTTICSQQNVTVKIKSSYFSSHSDWVFRVYDKDKIQRGTMNGSGEFVITSGNLSKYIASGEDYKVYVSEQQPNGGEQESPTPEPFYIRATASPTITGDNDICDDDYSNNNYTWTNKSDYSSVDEFDCVGCSASSISGNVITVTWDKTAGTHKIRAQGTKNNCTSTLKEYSVTVRDEVNNNYTVGGTSSVCSGSTGSITLSDSQTGLGKYVLYGDGTRESSTLKNGSGAQLTWPGMATGIAWTIYLEHSTCGSYQMSGSKTISTYSVPNAPSITGTTDICNDSQISLTGGGAGTLWEWQKYQSSSWSTVSGQTDDSFVHTVNTSITKYRAKYQDSNGCWSTRKEKAVHIEVVPGTINVTGLATICVGDEIQTYNVSGTADTYQWGSINGSLDVTTGNEVVSTWDNSKSSWQVKARGVNTYGAATCPGAYDIHNVTLRKDIEYYEVSGSANVCKDEQGNITLSNSQLEFNYYLFDGETQVPDSNKPGTGSGLSWSIEPGSYSVRLYHANCDWYNMGSFTINERLKSGSPTVSGDLDICDGGEITLTGNTANAQLGWQWSKYENDVWSDVTSDNSEIMIHTVNTNITKYKASYTDGNGCVSSEKEIAVNVLSIPQLPEISGLELVCVDDETQTYLISGDATDYEWIVTNGSATSNTGSSITVTWDKTKSNDWTLQARGIKNDGDASCEGNHQTFEVLLKKDIEFIPLIGDEYVCKGGTGSISLSHSQASRGFYSLYINGNKSFNAQDAKFGTGAALEWTELEPNNTYTILLETSDCSTYQMPGSMELKEYLVPEKPLVIGNLEICGEGEKEVTIFGEAGGELATFYEIYRDNYITLGTVQLDNAGYAKYTLDIVEGSTSYAVSFVNSSGCESATLDMEIILYDGELGKIGSEELCQKSSELYLFDFVEDKSGQWESNTYIFNQSFFDPADLSEGIHTFDYTVTSEAGCINTGYLELVIKENPSTPEIESVYNTCEEDNYTISIDNALNGITYEWYDDQNNLLNTGDTYELVSSDNFQFYVNAINKVNCFASTDLSAFNSRHIDGDISSSVNGKASSGETVVFQADFNGTSYYWNFTGGIESYKEDPTIVFNMPDTTINISLLVGNEYGCEKLFEYPDYLSLVDENDQYSDKGESKGDPTETLRIKRNETSISMYPNPSINGEVTISLFSLKNETMSLRVYDLLNKQAEDLTIILTTGDNEFKVPLGNVHTKVYVIYATASQWEKPLIVAGIKL